MIDKMKNSLWILLGFLCLNVHQGTSLFFVQVVQQLSWTFFSESHKPLFIPAKLDFDDYGYVVYSIRPKIDNSCPNLVIDKATGNVKLQRITTGGQMPNYCNYTVSAKLEGQVGHRRKSEASMMLSLLGMNEPSLDCSVTSKEQLCFTGMKEINVQVVENRKEKELLAKLGQETKRCPRMKLKYNVKMNESSILSMKNDSDNDFELLAEAQLDREEKSEYSFTIECLWAFENGKSWEALTIPGKLTILDEDDNSPKTQNFTTYEVYDISFLHTDNQYKPKTQVHPKDTNRLLVVDRDSLEVNNFELLVINDTWGLLNVGKKVIPNNGSTVVLLKVMLSEEAGSLKPWHGLYCVEARLNDTTMVQTLESPIMAYLICLHWGIPRLQAPDINLHPRQIVHENAFCDSNCVVYISVVAFVVCAAAIFSLVCWKSRFMQHKRRKCPPVKPGVLLNNGIIGGASGTEDYAGHNSDLEYPSNANGVGRNSSHLQDADPYMMGDPKWEVERSTLVLEQILGEGEFGRVLKARLRSPEYIGGYISVAVKTLKDNHVENGKSSRQEFMAEFVLLKQVDHPNVIKLLGACTSAGGPLYLIMEYAELGSLRSFLRKCRRIEELNENLTDAEGNDSMLASSKYIISPNEVLGFSWQIAKGMTYLSDMKMVHRDLAARNILLTESKVCKISDFGLTRDIYVDDAYKKKSKDRVPVKWLAPECLADELYTTKSDVWAYGILLWELVTLGTSPYPGIQTEQIYPLLKSGYRMPLPPNCSFELYSLMRMCWAGEPQNRPSFREIGLSLCKLLEEGIDYLKLDIPLVSNPGYQYFNGPHQRETEITDTDQVLEVSFESSRLITPPATSNEDSESAQLSYANIRPAYINYDAVGDEAPQGEPGSPIKRLAVVSSSSGYESPIKHPKRLMMTD